MRDKVVIITGATSGLGLQVAFELAQAGATVCLVGRTPRKLEQCVQRIVETTGNAAVSSVQADFESLASVRAASFELKRRYPRIDVLINNAGVYWRERKLTADGFERTFAVNHLAAFLLTNELLPSLQASAQGRIVNVSSSGHERATFDLNDLQSERGFKPFKAYGRSKLANILFAYELARRLAGTRVTVNALHPGEVRTAIGANNGIWVRMWLWFNGRHRISVEQGAQTIVYLASAPDVATVTGKYFVDCREAPSSALSHDRNLAAGLWDASEKLLRGVAQR